MQAMPHSPPTIVLTRQRRVHNKVKTGCLTCKIRRKKCDETRPFCTPCTSTGRKCDGYADVKEPQVTVVPASHKSDWQECAQYPTWQASGTPIFDPIADDDWQRRDCPAATPHLDETQTGLGSCPFYKNVSSVLQLASELEYNCFDFFRYHTGPFIAGHLDVSVGPALLYEGCFNYPIVLHAATAVAAVHRRYELGITPEAFKWCAISDRLYRKVIGKMIRAAADGEFDKRPDVYLLLAKLLCTFETFQDNHRNAAQYMASAFKHLLSKPVIGVLNERQAVDIELSLVTLEHFFLKLEHYAAYLHAQSLEFLKSGSFKYMPGFKIPATFETIEEARDCLFAEVRHIRDIGYCLASSTENMCNTKQYHLRRLMEWTVAYGNYSQLHRPPRGTLFPQFGNLLKFYREAAIIYLLQHNSSIDNEMGFNGDGSTTLLANPFNQTHSHPNKSLTAHFARLTLLTDGMINQEGPFATNHSNQQTLRTTGLYMGYTSFRTSDVRAQIRAAMGPYPTSNSTEGDTLTIHNVTERVSSHEEVAVEDLLQRADGDRSSWVHVTHFIESGTLRTISCREQDGVKGLVWCRDWYKLDDSGSTLLSPLHSPLHSPMQFV